jgi:tetratricopeptide (TPR) repeat protein
MSRKPKKRTPRDERSVPSGRATVMGEPPELRVAKSLFRRGEFDESLRQFAEAVRRYPRNITVLIDAARAFGRRHQLDRADVYLQRAAQQMPRRPDVQALIGESYRMLGMIPDAQRAFERVVTLVDDGIEAQLELAFLYERRHLLDRALEVLNRYLRVRAEHPAGCILRGRILRRLQRHEEAESVLSELIANRRTSPAAQAEAFGELTLLMDHQGRYEEAWRANAAAKQIQLQQDAREWSAAQIVFRRFGDLANSLTRSSVQNWPQQPPRSPQRLAWLTGFPRSGTTLLEQLLDAHSQIVCSEELDVLAREVFPDIAVQQSHETPILPLLDALDTSRCERLRDRYVAMMAGHHRDGWGGRLHVDKNPALTLMIPVICRLFPEARILVALRDPRDVIVSCFLRYLPLNPVSVCFLTLDRLVDRYLGDLSAWLKYRDLFAPQLFATRYEDLVSDPVGQAGKVCEFLGVPWEAEILDYRVSQVGKAVASPTYEDVAKPIYTSAMGRWRNYEDQLGEVLPKLEAVMQNLGYA